jgi:hypothetical protein
LRVEDGLLAGHVENEGLPSPYDLQECEGGWLIVCFGAHVIVKVYNDKGVRRETLGGRGSGDGQFDGPSALALTTTGALYVREKGNGGRYQVFK